MGIQVGYTGVLPTHRPRAEEQTQTSGAGPGSPARAGVGGSGAGTTPSRVPGPAGARPAPGPPTPAPWAYGARFAVQGPPHGQKARFHYISQKLSEKDEVSTKSVQKACHSPCFQNRSKKSPLEIPRFPISPAFSHKELMVPFWPMVSVLCQNDEVSTVCTPLNVTRKGRQIPPRCHGASSYCDTAPHLTQRGILIDTRYP